MVEYVFLKKYKTHFLHVRTGTLFAHEQVRGGNWNAIRGRGPQDAFSLNIPRIYISTFNIHLLARQTAQGFSSPAAEPEFGSSIPPQGLLGQVRVCVALGKLQSLGGGGAAPTAGIKGKTRWPGTELEMVPICRWENKNCKVTGDFLVEQRSQPGVSTSYLLVILLTLCHTVERTSRKQTSTCNALWERSISFLLYWAILAIVVVWFFWSSLMSSDIIYKHTESSLTVQGKWTCSGHPSYSCAF